jgi:hypothetical protein
MGCLFCEAKIKDHQEKILTQKLPEIQKLPTI